MTDAQAIEELLILAKSLAREVEADTGYKMEIPEALRLAAQLLQVQRLNTIADATTGLNTQGISVFNG